MMRLDELTIGAFKNLRDFHVDFDEHSSYTVLVGGNGAGKSNLLEALTLIFGHLDLDEAAPFDYVLRYRCRGSEIEATGKAGKHSTFRRRVEGSDEAFRKLSRREFMSDDENDRPYYRPAFVFGYYSGPNDRLSSLYDAHRNRYYNWIIRGTERRNREITDPNTLRRLFYAENLHGQFALIAFFMESEGQAAADQEFLKEYLQMDGLDSVLFALRDPPWPAREDGDSRFWGAKGEVRDFLDRLYAEAMLPGRMPRRMASGIGNESSVQNLYLFLPDQASLQRVYDTYRDQYAFFTALESTHLSQLLAEVRTRVRMTPEAGGGPFTYRDLSEGEQQLLLVLGLLKFTARNEALFLLDEPDTHLNPAWSTEYLTFLDRFIHGRETCHIVMSTHDPLVFSRLHREQVRIVRREGDGRVVAEAPLDDPVGMGITAILASDLFRLPSGGLDAETLRALEKQRQLSQQNKDLTEAEARELHEITARLEQLGFWLNHRDPIQQLFRERFVPRWLARTDAAETIETSLTIEQVRRREEVADSIAAEIAAELEAERVGQ
jgi:predicted ATPase